MNTVPRSNPDHNTPEKQVKPQGQYWHFQRERDRNRRRGLRGLVRVSDLIEPALRDLLARKAGAK